MEHNWITGAFYALFFVASGLFVFPLVEKLRVRMKNASRMKRITAREKGEENSRLLQIPAIRKLASEMEIAGIRTQVELLLVYMAALGLLGFSAATELVYKLQEWFAVGVDRVAHVNPWMFSVVFGLFIGGVPYFLVQFRVQRYRHKIARNMITVVQNLIGHYRHSMTLMELIKSSASTMPQAIRGEWRRLELALTIRSHKEALLEFERRVDNRWVVDLVELLDLFGSYGTNIHEGLRKLSVKMQTSKKNEEARIAVVTAFRLGTIFMAGFAVFAIVFNIYTDGSNYGAYFIRPFGRYLVSGSMILIVFFLVFVARIGKRSF